MILRFHLEAIRNKYVTLLDDLDERGRRRWAAVEARALGRGGITAVEEQLYLNLYEQTRLERERAFQKASDRRNDHWPVAAMGH